MNLTSVDNYTLKDLLLYNPWDKQKRTLELTRIFPEEIFIKDLLITPSIFTDLKENLVQRINPKDMFFKPFYILSGYSGNGKTTFLYWFKDQIKLENYYFEIINIIDKHIQIDNGIKLVQASLVKKYYKSCNSRPKKKTIDFILENGSVYRDYLQDDIDKLSDLGNNFYGEESPANCNEINSFLEDISFEKFLIIFMTDQVFEFKDNPSLKNKTSYVYCFDNLDEIDMEYINPQMWKAIKDLSSTMVAISEETSLDFEFSKKITFLLVFREANIACGSAQLNDAIGHQVDYKRFIYTGGAKEIILERVKKFNGIRTEKTKLLIDFINIICHEYLFDYFLMPLFNYDYRLICEAFVAFIEDETIDNKKYQLLSVTIEQYKSIPNTYKCLKRGIFINSFIRFFAKNNYLKKLAPTNREEERNENSAYCNKARLMLTVFSNFSFPNPNGFPIDERELDEIKPIQFSLKKAYKICKVFLNNCSEFFEILSELIDLNKSSWAHLITVYGKKASCDVETYKFDFSEEISILERIDKNEISKDEDQRISNIYISLNASAYVYLRHIIPNFEYISGYKSQEKKIDWYLLKPLVQLTDITTFSKQSEFEDRTEFYILWEFEKQINIVYDKVYLYAKNNMNFFQKVFKNYSKEEYCKTSDYNFRGDYVSHKLIRESNIPKKRYSFFISRLISTHINYLEHFRQYITNEGFTNIESNINKKDMAIPQNNTKTKINNFLLKKIENYIDLLIEVDDPSLKSVSKKLKDALNMAKQKPSYWISCNQAQHPT
ncbi:MAG: hypothetical protein GQ564_09940 [Bacteroidales bacterium]|nr:hypothetical protein [Bacteroidales bacterium]